MNVTLGSQAGDALTVGTQNTFIGQEAGLSVAAGGSNTLIGYQAGTLLTGSRNVLIGNECGDTLTASSDCLAIGTASTRALVSGDFAKDNIALCLASGVKPTNYGAGTEGQGVLLLDDATTNPAGVPNGGSGGIIYVDGNNLFYLNAAGTAVNLTSNVNVSGADTQVQFNDSGSHGGDSAFTFNKTDNTLTVLGAATKASLVASSGAGATPSYAFTGDLDTGLSAENANELCLSAGGVCALTVTKGATTGNVALGDAPTNYGAGTEGDGVTFIPDAVTNPSGIPNGGSGGLLYVDGTDLNYLDSTGTVRVLSNVPDAGVAMKTGEKSVSFGGGTVDLAEIAPVLGTDNCSIVDVLITLSDAAANVCKIMSMRLVLNVFGGALTYTRLRTDRRDPNITFAVVANKLRFTVSQDASNAQQASYCIQLCKPGSVAIPTVTTL